MLWFDGLGGAALPLELAQLETLSAERGRVFDRYRELMLWQAEAARCLELPVFGAALARLDGATAAEVLRSVAHIRKCWRAAQLQLWSAPSGRWSRALPAFAAALEGTREAFARAVSLAGLHASQLVGGGHEDTQT